MGSGNGRFSGAQRWACAALEPEMASFDCGSLNFGDRVFENSLPFLRELAGVFREHRIKPELECFEAGHIETALRLRDEGLLEEPLVFQFVLGVRGGAPATMGHANCMRSLIPDQAAWSICGVGAAQLRMGLFGLAAGGHLRTGLEDNLYYRKGEVAVSNAQLVARIVRIAEEAGRRPATAGEARAILGLGSNYYATARPPASRCDELSPQIKRVHHAGIPVSNLDRSLEFFRTAFGLVPTFIAEAEGEALAAAVGVLRAHSRCAFIEAPGGTSIELREYLEPIGRTHDRHNNDVGATHVCLEVDDIDHVCGALIAQGIKCLSSPMTATTGDLAGWRFVYFNDPIDGVTYELMQAPTAS